ncbi:hypothetical protein SLA2020_072600 [Shorea laevis]
MAANLGVITVTAGVGVVKVAAGVGLTKVPAGLTRVERLTNPVRLKVATRVEKLTTPVHLKVAVSPVTNLPFVVKLSRDPTKLSFATHPAATRNGLGA